MKKSLFLFCQMVLFSTALSAMEEAIVVTPEGYVGINTSSPTEILEVEGDTKLNQDLTVEGDTVLNGDLYVKGTIYTDEAYKDWAVGQYYSIPMDQRSTTPDIDIVDLPIEWTVYDLSSKLPDGVKRIRAYMYACGNDGTHETFIFIPGHMAVQLKKICD